MEKEIEKNENEIKEEEITEEQLTEEELENVSGGKYNYRSYNSGGSYLRR